MKVIITIFVLVTIVYSMNLIEKYSYQSGYIDAQIEGAKHLKICMGEKESEWLFNNKK